MTTFPKKLEEATDEELMSWINNINPNFVHLASDELTRRNIKKLNQSIDNGVVQAKKSSETGNRLTVAIFLLTMVLLLVAIAQFILSFAYSNNVKIIVFGVFMVLAIIVTMVFLSKKFFKETK